MNAVVHEIMEEMVASQTHQAQALCSIAESLERIASVVPAINAIADAADKPVKAGAVVEAIMDLRVHLSRIATAAETKGEADPPRVF